MIEASTTIFRFEVFSLSILILFNCVFFASSDFINALIIIGVINIKKNTKIFLIRLILDINKIIKIAKKRQIKFNLPSLEIIK